METPNVYESIKRTITDMEEKYKKQFDASTMRFYYRGHSDNKWELKPTICRQSGEKHPESYYIKKQSEMVIGIKALHCLKISPIYNIMVIALAFWIIRQMLM